MFRLDMLSPLDPSRDLRLSGQVIYTGKSSMEVAVKMETIGMGLEEETVLLGENSSPRSWVLKLSDPFQGRFSMVCRDALTHRARNVHPLIISTTEEESLRSMGEGWLPPASHVAYYSFTLGRYEETPTIAGASLAFACSPELSRG